MFKKVGLLVQAVRDVMTLLLFFYLVNVQLRYLPVTFFLNFFCAGHVLDVVEKVNKL